jgi:hypothetical protein
MAGYFFRLTLTASLILLGFGAYFLYESASYAGPAQLPGVLGGAVLLNLGIFLLCSQTWVVLRQAALNEQNRKS